MLLLIVGNSLDLGLLGRLGDIFFFFFFLCVCVCVCVCVSERLDVGRHGVMVFVPLFLERKEEFRSFETFFFFFFFSPRP